MWLRYDKVDRGTWLRETSTWPRCCISAEFNEKLRGKCNYNPAFVVGSKNLRASSYKDHAATNMFFFSRSRAPLMSQNTHLLLRPIQTIYRMAGNFGGKIFWRIAENMSFGGIYFGG